MIKTLLMTAAMLMSLSACQGQNARDILGLGRNAPDEFRVVSRPPLSTPKDFTLRPPQPGDNDLGMPAPDKQARALVIEGKDLSSLNYNYTRQMGEAETSVGIVNSYDLGSAAESALLSRAGVDEADPAIRETLYKERLDKTAEEKSNWLFPKKTDESAVLVDAKAEKARLEANETAGRAVTEGETPMIEPKEKSVLQSLFD